MPTQELVTLTITTEQGNFTSIYSAAGLAGLRFPSGRSSTKRFASGRTPEISRWHKLTSQALEDVLAGRLPVRLPPLDLSGGTEFQQLVWSALRTIKLGQTRSYGQIAASIGHPKAVRAVGGACGANPIPLLVPCHRVLAANRKIGGFSGGLDWKRRLLECEGVQVC